MVEVSVMPGTAKRGGQPPKAAVSKLPNGQRQSQSPALDRNIQASIGDKLRMMYGELSEQPVPDRLVAILDRLGADKRGR
jgi:hypothetical protein